MTKLQERHYQAGYHTALSDDRKDVDWYLDKRNAANAAEFERGWFDALEDMSTYDDQCLRRWQSQTGPQQ